MPPHLKRYWLFAGAEYYPRGGMTDFVESSDSLADFEMTYKELHDFRYYSRPNQDDKFNYNWYHIFDSETGLVVKAQQRSSDVAASELDSEFAEVNELALKHWLAVNLESLACVDGAICTADDGSNVSHETHPYDWLIRNAARVREFIEVWESQHDDHARSPAGP